MQGMIGHHSQALEMTDAACRRGAASEDMRMLALRIEVSQADEIKMMQRLARGARPAACRIRTRITRRRDVDAGHADAGRDGAAGRSARAPEFDRLFLELMIKHHEGALVMVKDLFATPGAGQESEMFAFASDVEADQRMEIDRMRAMLMRRRSQVMRRLSSATLRTAACAAAVLARRAAARAGRGRRSRRVIDDPRVGSKPGCATPGRSRATWSSLSSLPKPPGFFDPKIARRRSDHRRERAARPATKPDAVRSRSRRRRRRRLAAMAAGLNFANSDLAFSGQHLFIGNFNGFNIYDIEDPRKPKLIASVVCPGGQGDVSVHGNLLFMSVEQTRGRIDCGTQGVEPAVSAERFRGVRIFDITRHQEAEAGRRGADLPRLAHAHARHRPEGQGQHLRLRIGHRRRSAPAKSSPAAPAGDPKDDPNTALFSIDVIQVPLAAPEKAHDRQPAAHLRRSGDRRDRGPVAGRRPRRRARRRRRRPTSATTSRCSPRSAWPPARAPATASCSTSRIR